MFAKVHNCAFAVDTQNSGYAALKSTVDIRNGLMHPKKKEEVILTDKAMEKASSAMLWLEQTYNKLIEQIQQQIQRQFLQHLSNYVPTETDLAYFRSLGIDYFDKLTPPPAASAPHS
jgi:hypothetical protein